jgi:hypothetical protein
MSHRNQRVCRQDSHVSRQKIADYSADLPTQESPGRKREILEQQLNVAILKHC